MQTLITRESLSNDIRKFGVKEGDVLYLRGNVGAIGSHKVKHFMIDSLLDVVGESGTIITASYNHLYSPWSLSERTVFTLKTHTNCGALPKLFLMRDDCFRSEHPSSSFVAIGPSAKFILKDHNENSLAFTPFKKMIELNAKMISFGCVGSNHGFPTIHYAEEELGLTKRFLSICFNSIYYYRNNKRKIFRRFDPGGCTGNSHSFYGEYIKNDVLEIHYIGDAFSIGGRMSEIYDVDYSILSANNDRAHCDNNNCIYCNVITPRKKYNFLRLIFYKLWIILFLLIKGFILYKDFKRYIRPEFHYDIDSDPVFAKYIRQKEE